MAKVSQMVPIYCRQRCTLEAARQLGFFARCSLWFVMSITSAL